MLHGAQYLKPSQRAEVTAGGISKLIFCAKSLQSCMTLCDPMVCSPPGSSRQEYWSGVPLPSPFGPITSWQIVGETVETVSDFIFLGSKITADGGCSLETKRRLLLWINLRPT